MIFHWSVSHIKRGLIYHYQIMKPLGIMMGSFEKHKMSGPKSCGKIFEIIRSLKDVHK